MRSSRLNSWQLNFSHRAQTMTGWSQLHPNLVSSGMKRWVTPLSLHHLEDEKDGVGDGTGILTDPVEQICTHNTGQPSWAEVSHCSLYCPLCRSKEAALQLQAFLCQKRKHRPHGSVGHHRIPLPTATYFHLCGHSKGYWWLDATLLERTSCFRQLQKFSLCSSVSQLRDL